MISVLQKKRKNKKGFTLAELLIVVGIIAILVAVAVPVFTTSLDEAKKARDDANLRAVRSAAAVEIMTNWGEYGTFQKNGADAAATSWTVEATVKNGGEIEITSITPGEVDAAAPGTINESNGTFTIAGMVIRDVKMP